MLWLLMSCSRSVLLIIQASGQLIAEFYKLYVVHLASVSNCKCRGGSSRKSSMDAIGVMLLSLVIVKQVLCTMRVPVQFFVLNYFQIFSFTHKKNCYFVYRRISQVFQPSILGEWSIYHFVGVDRHTFPHTLMAHRCPDGLTEL